LDLRQRLIDALQAGEPIEAARARLRVSKSTAYLWWRKFTATGDVRPAYLTYDVKLAPAVPAPDLKGENKAARMELREQLIAAIRSGQSASHAANRLGIRRTTAIRWQAEYAATGKSTPKARGGDTCSHHTAQFADLMMAEFETNPDVRVIDVKNALMAQGVALSRDRIDRFFRRRGILLKGSGRVKPQLSSQ
jgi:transposase